VGFGGLKMDIRMKKSLLSTSIEFKGTEGEFSRFRKKLQYNFDGYFKDWD
jgi:hypothetical protein